MHLEPGAVCKLHTRIRIYREKYRRDLTKKKVFYLFENIYINDINFKYLNYFFDKKFRIKNQIKLFLKQKKIKRKRRRETKNRNEII
mgnify:CR=1 FL=1